MKAGRPRKTIEQKQINGTLRKDRELDNYLHHETLRSVPKVSDDLNKDGQNFFNYYSTILLKKGLLTISFIPDIELAASWYSIYKQAQRNIKESWYTQTAPNGGWKQMGPDITALEKATKALTNFYTRYGLDLVSSQRIAIPDIDTDEFD